MEIWTDLRNAFEDFSIGMKKSKNAWNRSAHNIDKTRSADEYNETKVKFGFGIPDF